MEQYSSNDTVIEFLKNEASGFNSLNKSEVEVIMRFSLLWSYFEYLALDRNAKKRSIENAIDTWFSDKDTDAPLFQKPMKYFFNRYYKENDFTKVYEGLRLNGTAKIAVENVLKSQSASKLKDKVLALFLIVYRIRNNLFHGEKWKYDLEGQYENFVQANDAIMIGIKLHKENNHIYESTL